MTSRLHCHTLAVAFRLQTSLRARAVTFVLSNATADCQEWRSVSNATAGTWPWRLLTVTPLRAAAVASHVVDARAHSLAVWRRVKHDATASVSSGVELNFGHRHGAAERGGEGGLKLTPLLALGVAFRNRHVTFAFRQWRCHV